MQDRAKKAATELDIYGGDESIAPETPLPREVSGGITSHSSLKKPRISLLYHPVTSVKERV